MSAKKPTPEFESVALAVGLVVIGIVMVIWPSAVDGASTSGRHGMVKAVLAAIWGVNGGLGCLALGGMYLGWLFRPWRLSAETPDEATA